MTIQILKKSKVSIPAGNTVLLFLDAENENVLTVTYQTSKIVQGNKVVSQVFETYEAKK